MAPALPTTECGIIVIAAAARAIVAELAEVIEIETAAAVIISAETALLVPVPSIAALILVAVGVEELSDPAEQSPRRTTATGRLLVPTERVEQIIDHQGSPF